MSNLTMRVLTSKNEFSALAGIHQATVWFYRWFTLTRILLGSAKLAVYRIVDLKDADAGYVDHGLILV